MILFFCAELSLHVSPRNKSRAQKKWSPLKSRICSRTKYFMVGWCGMEKAKVVLKQNCHSSFHSGSFLIRCFIFSLGEHFPSNSSVLPRNLLNSVPSEKKTFPSSLSSVSLLIPWPPSLPFLQTVPSVIQASVQKLSLTQWAATDLSPCSSKLTFLFITHWWPSPSFRKPFPGIIHIPSSTLLANSPYFVKLVFLPFMSFLFFSLYVLWSEVAQSCPTLCDPMDCSLVFSPWNFPGKSTGVGCHFLLQGIFPT